MAKYIFIDTSRSTRTLENLASSNVSHLVLKIEAANESAAETELATINSDYWVASDTITQPAGETTDSLVLPKEAIT